MVVWFDGNFEDFVKFIKMLIINGFELYVKLFNKFKFKFFGDDCKVRGYV